MQLHLGQRHQKRLNPSLIRRTFGQQRGQPPAQVGPDGGPCAHHLVPEGHVEQRAPGEGKQPLFLESRHVEDIVPNGHTAAQLLVPDREHPAG